MMAQPSKTLNEAWDRYRAAIDELTEMLREDSRATEPVALADGYDHIQALLANAQANIIYPDPRLPQIIEDYSMLYNYCAPTGDFKYSNIILDPAGRYRIFGKRGTAHAIDFQQCEGWWPPEDNGPTRALRHDTIDGSGIEFSSDGSFEFILSANRPGKGNWLKKDPNATTIFVRQIFYDWEREEPGEIFIERLDEPGPERDATASMVTRIDQARMSILFLAKAGFAMIPNILKEVGFNAFKEEFWAGVGGQTNQNYFSAAFDLEKGESLLLEWEPPETSFYWSLQLYNVWWQAIDYRNHQSSLNGHQVKLGEDGRARILIGPDDPGFANWADTAGRRQGQMLIRCKHSGEREEVPLPSLRLIKTDDAAAVLAAYEKRASLQERKQTIAQRRRHIMRRFKR
jgi:hypothetical protein